MPVHKKYPAHLKAAKLNSVDLLAAGSNLFYFFIFRVVEYKTLFWFIDYASNTSHCDFLRAVDR